MRYLRVFPVLQSAKARWLHFDKRRAWFDREDPFCVVTLQLVGEGVHDIAFQGADREGAPLHCEAFGQAQVPEGRNAFPRQPDAQKRLVQLRLEMPTRGPLWLLDAVTGETLVILQPKIVYPDFLFELLQDKLAMDSAQVPVNFVETGTLFGHTTLHASYWFDKVVTIELSETLHALAKQSLAHRSNISCLHGNSADRLPEVIAGLQGATLFFLDAHWSGDAKVDWESSPWGGYPVDTARLENTGMGEADRQVPLLQELKVIAGQHPAAAVVLIDDWASVGQSDQGFPGEDWTNMEQTQLLNWLDSHERTLAHYPAEAKRYVWVLKEAADCLEG